MKVKGLLFASLAIAALMIGFAFYASSLLPEGAQLPTHFDGAGNPDRYGNALPALLLPAGVVLFLALLSAAIPFIEPLQNRLEGSAPLLRVAWISTLALMVAVQLVIGGPALGWALAPTLIMSAVGVMLIAIGNMLPKSRPGFFVGIRTPWTITDEDNWIATHRLGGKLMIVAGLVFLVAPFLPVPPGVRIALTLGSVVPAALIPVAYSWWFWHRKKGDAAKG
jgi:uncharacterized membrane protein